MSWYNDLWVNATTGNLTAGQQAEIAQSASNDLLKCRETPDDPQCKKLLQDNTAIVSYIAKSDSVCDGVLNAPVIGCVDSWTMVAVWTVGILFVIGIAYHVIINKLSK